MCRVTELDREIDGLARRIICTNGKDRTVHTLDLKRSRVVLPCPSAALLPREIHPTVPMRTRETVANASNRLLTICVTSPI